MARKGETLWEVSRSSIIKEERLGGVLREGYIGVQHYALRADGKLLEKYQTKNLDGSSRYDWGWKRSTRFTKTVGGGEEILERLKQAGFELTSFTPNAKMPESRRAARRW